MLDRITSDIPSFHLKLPLYIRQQPKKMWNIVSPIFPFAARWTRHSTTPHYEDSTYVGLDFAKELLQMYYKVVCFTLYEESFDILHTFLQQEPKGYGLVVGQMIGHLELTMVLKHFTGWLSEMDYEIQFEENKKATAIQTQKLEEQLEALLMIESRCKIGLNIWISRGIVGLFQFGEVVDVLLPIVEVLKGKGCRIDVSVSSSPYETYGSSNRWGKWKILDIDQEPIEGVLRKTVEVCLLWTLLIAGCCRLT
jgi:hypothetical protein